MRLPALCHKETGRHSGSDCFSEYFWGFRPNPERRCALRFKTSAVAMSSLLHQGEMRHEIPEEPVARARPLLARERPLFAAPAFFTRTRILHSQRRRLLLASRRHLLARARILLASWCWVTRASIDGNSGGSRISGEARRSAPRTPTCIASLVFLIKSCQRLLLRGCQKPVCA
jgi:hypothetical protein